MQLEDITLELEVMSSNFHLNHCHRDELSKVESDSDQTCVYGPPLDGFDPIKLKLIGSTTRSGLVPPPDAASDTFAKTLACGHRYGRQTGRNEQKEK